ncbi:DUF4291 domain-containing protein [bacterium]|nr:DUF4291 domain-containing protein [bacterium]
MRQIRARYCDQSLVVYQAYPREIGAAALQAGRFVPPFSLQRMTWVKPSFLWMMQRSGWGQKAGQEWVLAVHIDRQVFEQALAQAVLTSPESEVYSDRGQWEELRQKAPVLVQWDPEYNLRGDKLPYRSLQVGLGRAIIRDYAENWILRIEDLRPLVSKILDLRRRGLWEQAARHLPEEKPYPLPPAIARRVGATAF